MAGILRRSDIAKPQKCLNPLPFELSGHRNEANTDLDKKNLHQILGLKEPNFLPNIATSLLDYYEFANRQQYRKIVKVKYVLLIWKKTFKKSYFS